MSPLPPILVSPLGHIVIKCSILKNSNKCFIFYHTSLELKVLVEDWCVSLISLSRLQGKHSLNFLHKKWHVSVRLIAYLKYVLPKSKALNDLGLNSFWSIIKCRWRNRNARDLFSLQISFMNLSFCFYDCFHFAVVG